jgi:hypothetical protein
METVILPEPETNTDLISLQNQNKGGPVFRFFDLPPEIRNRIYSYVLFSPKSITSTSHGAAAANARPAPLPHRVNLFIAASRLHDEATYTFYSTQTFRIFPIIDFSRLPTVSTISPRYRPAITTIELILGSSWTAPPKSWTINNGLGLREMSRVCTLKIFVQCDPSDPAFEGFRVSRYHYTWFAGELLRQILIPIPSLKQVEFDANPSVQKTGSLVARLVYEVRQAGKAVMYGPQRGWSSEDDHELEKVEVLK